MGSLPDVPAQQIFSSLSSNSHGQSKHMSLWLILIPCLHFLDLQCSSRSSKCLIRSRCTWDFSHLTLNDSIHGVFDEKECNCYLWIYGSSWLYSSQPSYSQDCSNHSKLLPISVARNGKGNVHHLIFCSEVHIPWSRMLWSWIPVLCAPAAIKYLCKPSSSFLHESCSSSFRKRLHVLIFMMTSTPRRPRRPLLQP